MPLEKEFQTLDVENPIDLLTITIPGEGDRSLRICTNATVSFGGLTFIGMPCEIDWVGKSGEGTELQSKLSVSDVSGQVGQLIDNFDDLVIGAIVNSKRTLSPFLDGGFTADPTRFLQFNMRINQWTGQYGVGFEFTLIPSASLERKKLPARTYLRRCSWEFRDPNCAASLLNNFDGMGMPTTLELAVCGKDLDSCKLYQNTTRYGGFPGVVRNG